MLDSFRDKNSIRMIAISIPKRLIKHFDKKEFYSPEEVESIFLKVKENDKNIAYAFAMFCCSKDFSEIALLREFTSSYSDLRTEIANKCFEGWPYFNFESLLSLSHDSPLPDLVNEVTDVGLDILRGI